MTKFIFCNRASQHRHGSFQGGRIILQANSQPSNHPNLQKSFRNLPADGSIPHLDEPPVSPPMADSNSGDGELRGGKPPWLISGPRFLEVGELTHPFVAKFGERSPAQKLMKVKKLPKFFGHKNPWKADLMSHVYFFKYSLLRHRLIQNKQFSHLPNQLVLRKKNVQLLPKQNINHQNLTTNLLFCDKKSPTPKEIR